MLIDHNITRMLSVSEVAAMLHVHSNTLRQWSNQGLIKTYRVCKRGDRRFAQEDVSEFLARLNASDQRPR